MRPPGLALVVMLLLAGCLEGPGPAGGGEPQPIVVRDLAKGPYSGIHERTREVVADEAAWRALWARHASGQSPAPPLPEVDFSVERVLAVVDGDRPDGCHDVQVGPASGTGEALTFTVVSWENETSAAGCTDAVTQPHHFVAVRDRDRDVRFQDRVERPRAEPLSQRTLDRGSFGGVQEDTRALLRTQAEWDALWARHRPNQPAPRVEFPNESVVAVVEHGPTGCFGVHVGNVTYDAAARLVIIPVVHERTPPHVNCVAALMDAFHYVAIPSRDGEARFVETEEDADVGGTEGYAMRTLAWGGSSGVHEPLRNVLRDEAAWRAFWANHTSNQAPPSKPPAVDFSKEAVLVALAGDRSNTCWALRVESVEPRADEVVVRVVTYAPPKGAMCGQMVSQPHHFVTYPRTDAPVRVVESAQDGPPPDV